MQSVSPKLKNSINNNNLKCLTHYFSNLFEHLFLHLPLFHSSTHFTVVFVTYLSTETQAKVTSCPLLAKAIRLFLIFILCIQWCASRCLTTALLVGKQPLICSVCQFLWCIYSHRDWFQVIDLLSQKAGWGRAGATAHNSGQTAFPPYRYNQHERLNSVK